MQIKYILFALVKTIKYFICAKKKKSNNMHNHFIAHKKKWISYQI